MRIYLKTREEAMRELDEAQENLDEALAYLSDVSRPLLFADNAGVAFELVAAAEERHAQAMENRMRVLIEESYQNGTGESSQRGQGERR